MNTGHIRSGGSRWPGSPTARTENKNLHGYVCSARVPDGRAAAVEWAFLPAGPGTYSQQVGAPINRRQGLDRRSWSRSSQQVVHACRGGANRSPASLDAMQRGQRAGRPHSKVRSAPWGPRTDAEPKPRRLRHRKKARRRLECTDPEARRAAADGGPAGRARRADGAVYYAKGVRGRALRYPAAPQESQGLRPPFAAVSRTSVARI